MTAAVALKYGGFVRIAAAQARRERGELYGRVTFFAVILGVFASLWHAVAEAGMPVAAEPRALVWYLAATEWIVLSTPPIHIEIQEAIRRGDIVCQLGRPASYVGAKFAEGLGLLATRAPVLGVTACVQAPAHGLGAAAEGDRLCRAVRPGCRGIAHGPVPGHWPPGVLARGCVACVLGVAKGVVRLRRPDDADRALPGFDSTRGGMDALSQPARRPGIVCPAREQRRIRGARARSRSLGRGNGVGRVVGVSACHIRADDQRRLAVLHSCVVSAFRLAFRRT